MSFVVDNIERRVIECAQQCGVDVALVERTIEEARRAYAMMAGNNALLPAEAIVELLDMLPVAKAMRSVLDEEEEAYRLRIIESSVADIVPMQQSIHQPLLLEPSNRARYRLGTDGTRRW